MAYINIAEWTPDQVTDWLKGLDDTMYNYIYSFTNNEVGGRQLLNIRPYELKQLGVSSIGHQEIVLEAVEILRNFHYNLDKDNLQFTALHVATAARNLHRQLASHRAVSNIETEILNDITRSIATIQPLISWLDRAPFHGQLQFNEIRRNMLRLGLEMATSAQRDRFVQNPVEQIKTTAEKLERLANYIIQDITDPMLLQPATLNLVTLKKRESDLGFNIVSNYHGIHRVTDIKYNSPAHNSGKVEDGDEIVQINYQTVVGWQYKSVIMQLRESLPDVLLTLKKRPKHMKIYGQIYMQPYRLPSKKRNMASRWEESLPSPRAGFLAAAKFTALPMKSNEKSIIPAAIVSVNGSGDGGASDTDSSCSDILTPTDTKSVEKEIRLYYPKPRSMLQRRNTISGDELFGRQRHVGGMPMWHERKDGVAQCDPASPSLRDKSISFGFGLEVTPRPTTCIGLTSGSAGTTKFSTGDLKRSLPELKSREQVKSVMDTISSDIVQQVLSPKSSKSGVSKVVRFVGNMKCPNYCVDEKYTCNVEDTILETFEPIPFVDDEEAAALEAHPNIATEETKNLPTAEEREFRPPKISLQPITTEIETNSSFSTASVRRGRLDKSHSTPAYDNTEDECDTPPPAVEPRKEFLLVTPPSPPPRPKKQSELYPKEVPPPPPKPANLRPNCDTSPKSLLGSTSLTGGRLEEHSVLVKDIPYVKTATPENNELETVARAKVLTLKKKINLISKRRKINLKFLGTGDIQGHLYRRTKDRRGITYWARFYFVLLDANLYGFRTKEAMKANCLIFLPGFTVSLAKEVHSKPYAFKVYHPSKSFYFATESQEALNQWIDFIGQATLRSTASMLLHSSQSEVGEIDVNVKQLFSETESSGEENDMSAISAKSLCISSPQAAVKDPIPVIKPLNSHSSSSVIKPDKRYLGSLRKLTKSSFISKPSSHNERKVSSDIPVPTEQYRSYRKVPGGSFGIQIGTNTPGYHDIALNCLSNRVEENNCLTESMTPSMPQRKLSLSSIRVSGTSAIEGGGYLVNNNFVSTSSLAPPSSIAQTPSYLTVEATLRPTLTRQEKQPPAHVSSSSNSFDDTSKYFKKTFPLNFIHASNPNLVEFDFQTSKTLDYSLPKINSANAWDAHQAIQGFVTLKDLMLQKQEEEAQEMYNNRVFLGVEKKNETRCANQHNSDEYQSQDRNSNQQHQHQQQIPEKWTQKRSLPKTPDYEISFKPDDEDIKRTRTKEGLKLRDFGYELISGDEPINGSSVGPIFTHQNLSETSTYNEHTTTAAMKTRQLLKTQHIFLTGQKGNKKHSSNSFSSATSASEMVSVAGIGTGEKRAGSFKKKGKLEAFKTSKERLFNFTKHATSASAASVSMTMTLPFNKKIGDNSTESASTYVGIKKSHTYNSELKDKMNVAAASAIRKEKKLLGSPLLHRTLFGHPNVQHHIGGVVSRGGSNGDLLPLIAATTAATSSVCCTGRGYDHEIFSQILFTKAPSYHSESAGKFRHLSSNCHIVAPDTLAPPPPVCPNDTTSAPPLPPHSSDTERSLTTTTSPSVIPENPNIERPPVFEPEIYSLTDPNTNIAFLRR